MPKCFVLFALLVFFAAFLSAQPVQVQFIFTADSHYGLTRAFRGAADVDAHVVNAAMIAKINRMPDFTFPADGGLRSAQPVGSIDFVVDGGDITNRAEMTAEVAIQSASASWTQFRQDYINGLTLMNPARQKVPSYVLPGNHDASNAIGSYKPMTPRTDSTSMVQIYNLMVAPSTPRAASSYDYDRDKIFVSHEAGGI